MAETIPYEQTKPNHHKELQTMDAYTKDGQYAFQFEQWGDIAESREDYGLDLPEDAFEGGEEVLIVLVPSGNNSWYYSKAISADQLQQALKSAGLLA